MRNFFEPAGHLPYVRPQVVAFKLEELFVIIALSRNTLRIGNPERHFPRRRLSSRRFSSLSHFHPPKVNAYNLKSCRRDHLSTSVPVARAVRSLLRQSDACFRSEPDAAHKRRE